jgi:hypothetical protein
MITIKIKQILTTDGLLIDTHNYIVYLEEKLERPFGKILELRFNIVDLEDMIRKNSLSEDFDIFDIVKVVTFRDRFYLRKKNTGFFVDM